MVAEEEFARAQNFLDPILRPQFRRDASSDTVSIAEALAKKSPGRNVADQAADLLESIHAAFSQSDKTQNEAEIALQNSDNRRVLECLLDVITLEGIYPYLLPGVGVPIQHRMPSSLSRFGVSIERAIDAIPRDERIDKIIDVLLVCAQNTPLTECILGRNIVDLLAIMLQYASVPTQADPKLRSRVNSFLLSVPLPILYPNLTILLRPEAPPWMKASVRECLEPLPLRPNGIHDTILFLSSSQRNTTMGDEVQASQGPTLTLGLLKQLATIVCIVPRSVDPDRWFQNLSAQLFVFLDSTDEDDQSVGSFILGAILGQRHIGAPGTAGWKYIAEPILSPLNGHSFNLPELKSKDNARTSAQILRAADRLARLLTLHPNPGLVKRLASRVVPALWILTCGPRNQSTNGSMSASKVLQQYLKEAGSQAIMKLLENIEADGPTTCRISWERGQQWMAVLEPRSASTKPTNVLTDLQSMSARVEILVELLRNIEADDLSQVCVNVFQLWMKDSGKSLTNAHLVEQGAKSPHSSFRYLKLLQSLIERCQERLASSPKYFVPLVSEILTSFVHDRSHETRHGVGLDTLADIATKANRSVGSVDDATNIVSIALSLLSVLLIDVQQFMASSDDANRLSLQTALRQLCGCADLPADAVFLAQGLLTQLSQAMGVEIGGLAMKPDIATPSDDALRHRMALEKIAAPEPPIRVEGLADLDTLIKQSSNVIVVSPTVVLLVFLLQEHDEYTHLAAIRSLTTLAARRPSETLRQLLDDFLDPNEDFVLDVRLKIAETINQIVLKFGSQLDRVTVAEIVNSAVLVGGRRPQRLKEADRRARETKKQRLTKEAGERTGNTSLQQPMDDDREDVTPADEITSRLLGKWAGTGREEDIRIRTSALSILDAALQQVFSALHQNSIEGAFDLILSILRLERDEGEAILRRSAVLCLRTLVAGVNNQIIERPSDAAARSQLLTDATAVLEDEIRDEPDDIARGHAMAIKESLEESQREALEIKLRGEDIRFDLGDRLQGLDVDPAPAGDFRSKIEEVG